VLAAPAALAQSTQLQTPQPQRPVFQNPGGVAGGFARTTSEDAAAKQKAQNLTPPGDMDAWEKNKQK
jgi:hypothetical protein